MNSNRCLIITPGSIGDTLSFTPILNLIREHLPEGALTDVASARPLQDFFKSVVGINEAFCVDNPPDEKLKYEWIFDFSGTANSVRFYSNLRYTHIAQKHFNAEFPEMSVDCGNRVPVEVFRKDLEGMYSNPDIPAFMVEAPLAGLVFKEDFWTYLSREITFPILELRKTKHTPHSADVFFIPGGSSFLKKWPIENYLNLYSHFQKNGICAEFILGDFELEYVEILRKKGIKHHFRKSLSELAYRIRGAKLVISNDCGLMHLAAVLGVPTLAIFGPTNRKCWFYYESYDPKRFKSFQVEGRERNPWGILKDLDEWNDWPCVEDVRQEICRRGIT